MALEIQVLSGDGHKCLWTVTNGLGQVQKCAGVKPVSVILILLINFATHWFSQNKETYLW